MDISPRKFKLKVKVPKVIRKHKEALDKQDIVNILNCTALTLNLKEMFKKKFFFYVEKHFKATFRFFFSFYVLLTNILIFLTLFIVILNCLN